MEGKLIKQRPDGKLRLPKNIIHGRTFLSIIFYSLFNLKHLF